MPDPQHRPNLGDVELGEDGLNSRERNALELIALGRCPNVDVVRKAIEDLAGHRRRAIDRLADDVLAAAPRVDELLERVRMGLDQATTTIIDAAEFSLEDAHRIKLLAHTFALLGGLEHDAHHARRQDAALEAEQRVKTLETASRDVLAAVIDAGAGSQALEEGRLEPLGNAIKALAEVLDR